MARKRRGEAQCSGENWQARGREETGCYTKQKRTDKLGCESGEAESSLVEADTQTGGRKPWRGGSGGDRCG
eukprot:6328397-Amphidinium_carterae.1